MGDPVNLNHARKAATNQKAGAEAATNRVKHGRTKAEKYADRAAKARRVALLDGAKREETGA